MRVNVHLCLCIRWDFPNAWAPLQWMIIQGLRTVDYHSMSTAETFTIFNSSDLPPDAPPQPSSACDIVRPDRWFNCSGSCAWCFPPGKDLSDMVGRHWLLANYVAFNNTGYMLEKYYGTTLHMTTAAEGRR